MVALFLALAAIQFMVAQNMPASSYITALGQIIIASYFMLFVGVESLGSYKLSVYCESARRYALRPLIAQFITASVVQLSFEAYFCCSTYRTGEEKRALQRWRSSKGRQSTALTAARAVARFNLAGKHAATERAPDQAPDQGPDQGRSDPEAESGDAAAYCNASVADHAPLTTADRKVSRWSALSASLQLNDSAKRPSEDLPEAKEQGAMARSDPGHAAAIDIVRLPTLKVSSTYRASSYQHLISGRASTCGDIGPFEP